MLAQRSTTLQLQTLSGSGRRNGVQTKQPILYSSYLPDLYAITGMVIFDPGDLRLPRVIVRSTPKFGMNNARRPLTAGRVRTFPDCKNYKKRN